MKEDPLYALHKTLPSVTHRMNVNGWKKILQASGKREDRVATFKSDKTDFKSKTVTWDKGENWVMIQGSIHKKEIIVTIYVPNIRTPKYIKRLLTGLKAEKDSNIIMTGNFSDPLSAMVGTSRLKIHKESGHT